VKGKQNGQPCSSPIAGFQQAGQSHVSLTTPRSKQRGPKPLGECSTSALFSFRHHHAGHRSLKIQPFALAFESDIAQNPSTAQVATLVIGCSRSLSRFFIVVKKSKLSMDVARDAGGFVAFMRWFKLRCSSSSSSTSTCIEMCNEASCCSTPLEQEAIAEVKDVVEVDPPPSHFPSHLLRGRLWTRATRVLH
jgi:hypothetical protein